MNGRKTADGELKDFDRYMQSVGKAIENHDELEKALRNAKDETKRKVLIVLMRALRENVIEAFSDLLSLLPNGDAAFEAVMHSMKADKHETGISGIKAFYNALKAYLETKPEEKQEVLLASLPDDIRDEIVAGFQKSNDTGISYFEDNPLFKEFVRREAKGQQDEATTITIARNNDMTIKSGELSIYESEILNNLAKCKREGYQVLKSGECFLSLGQLYKWISGGAKDSLSDVQRAELMDSLKAMRHRNINYTTEEYLADVLGVDIQGELAGFKVKEADEQLLNCDFYTGEIKGQKATVVVFKFARVINRMLDVFPWYETTKEEVKRIQYISNGRLKDWNLTKERIELRTSILRFVMSYIRARKAGRLYSNRKPYADIFEECKIDTTHTQKRSRKIGDIAVILDHLQRIGLISSWCEYKNRGSKKPDGVTIRLEGNLTEGG